VAIAPVGLTGLNWADGEILGARAAGEIRHPFTLSTMSILLDRGRGGRGDESLSGSSST